MKDKKTIKDLYMSIQEEFGREIMNKKEYDDISKESNKLYEQLKSMIDEKEFNVFGDFIDSYTQQMSIEIEEYFVKGFSIANKLRDESLSK